MKVLEISPGNGWYSEILSKFLKDTDSYFVSKYKVPPVKVVGENQKKFDEYFSANKNKFGGVKSVFFNDKNILESRVKKDLIWSLPSETPIIGSDLIQLRMFTVLFIK